MSQTKSSCPTLTPDILIRAYSPLFSGLLQKIIFNNDYEPKYYYLPYQSNNSIP